MFKKYFPVLFLSVSVLPTCWASTLTVRSDEALPHSFRSSHYSDMFVPFNVDRDKIMAMELELNNPHTTLERRQILATIAHEDAKYSFNLYSRLYRRFLFRSCAGSRVVAHQDLQNGLKYYQETCERETLKLKEATGYVTPYTFVPEELFSLNVDGAPSSSTEFSLPVFSFEATASQMAKDLSRELNSFVLGGGDFENDNDAEAPLGFFRERRAEIVYDYQGLEEVKAAYDSYDSTLGSGVAVIDQDVHAFNRQVNFKKILPPLFSGDRSSSFILPAADVVAALKASEAYKEKQDKGTLDRAFTQLLAHLAVNPVEAGETGANVAHLLSRIWSIIQYDSYEIHAFFYVMEDGLKTNGGCFPGYAGRLAQYYVNKLREQQFTKRKYTYY